MERLRLTIKRSLNYSLVVLLALLSPVPVIAQGESSTPPPDQSAVTAPPEQPASTPSAETSTPVPPKPETGPTQPTGADENKYQYNELTGLWESEQYTWDPVTRQTKPKVAPSYSYNPATGYWDTTEWRYSPESGKYIPNTVSVASTPEGANLATPFSSNDPSSPSYNQNGVNGSHPTSSSSFDQFYNAQISNNIASLAQSGSATVAQNTLGGGAASGDALAMANIINLLQTSWNPNGNIATFSSNIDGDVVGDLHIDPGSLTQPQLKTAANAPDQVDINTTTNNRIDNNVALRATTGDAAVLSNTQGGDATTGSAKAVANVVNVINSAIAAGQSFLGVLNINGNLNGDILLPPDILKTLLASNAPEAQLNTAQVGNTKVLAEFTDNQNINNNTNLVATSGNATVAQNTQAGDGASGNANTNLTLLNLTGRQVIGNNSLLVFVNVLGKWVGVIMDAPAGSTAAALGSGISQNTALASAEELARITATNNSTINNNIDVSAESGDATVARNTRAGNARSGDASAAINLLNISNSQLSLTDWFGVLFINVFGTWNGSFGVDTAAGNQVATGGMGGGQNAATAAASDVRVFKFVPKSNNSYDVEPVETAADLPAESSNQPVKALAATMSAPKPPTTGSGSTASAASSYWVVPIVSLAMGLLFLAGDRFKDWYQYRRTRTVNGSQFIVRYR